MSDLLTVKQIAEAQAMSSEWFKIIENNLSRPGLEKAAPVTPIGAGVTSEGHESHVGRLSRSLAQLSSSPYRSSKYGFSIRFPRGWDVKEGAADTTLVKAVDPNKVTGIRMLSVADLGATGQFDPWSKSPSDIHSELSKVFAALGGKWTSTGFEKVTIGGKRAVKITGRSELAGMRLSGVQWLLCRRNHMLKFQLSTNAGSGDFSATLPLGEAAISTLQFD